jgi:hypothetical protein
MGALSTCCEVIAGRHASCGWIIHTNIFLRGVCPVSPWGWGLPGGNYQELADGLTENGYETSVTDIKNSKRSKVVVDQLKNLKGKDVDAFKAVLLERYPNLKF